MSTHNDSSVKLGVGGTVAGSDCTVRYRLRCVWNYSRYHCL